MDDGKTLAQLVEEGHEKKFVSLETASKISGYTPEYLKRLCSGDIAEYRLRPDGTCAIELSALLRATQTLLVSYDGIQFIDKGTLIEATPIQATVSTQQSVGNTKETNREEPEEGGRVKQQGALSYVGRSVMSDPDHPDIETHATHKVHVPIVDLSEHGVVVMRDDEGHIHEAPLENVIPEVAPMTLPPIKTQVVEEKPEPPVREPLPPSLYRPIETQVDVAEHHDDAPLLPPLMEKPVLPVPLTTTLLAATRKSEVPSRHILITKDEVPTYAPEPFSDPIAHSSSLAQHAAELTGVVGKEVRRTTPPRLLATRIASVDLVANRESVGLFTPDWKGRPELPSGSRAKPLFDLEESHPLLASGTFNAVFLAVFAGAVAALLSVPVWHKETAVSFDRPGEVVTGLAGVGAAGAPQDDVNPGPPTNSEEGFYSDEVIITRGTADEDAAAVRPLYRDHYGAPVVVEIKRNVSTTSVKSVAH